MKTIKTYLSVYEFLELGGELKAGDIIFTDNDMNTPVVVHDKVCNKGIPVMEKEYNKKTKQTEDKLTYYGTGWTKVECEIKLAVEETILK